MLVLGLFLKLLDNQALILARSGLLVEITLVVCV